MVCKLDTLITNVSIEDIIPYIVVDKKQKPRISEKLVESRLEKIVSKVKIDNNPKLIGIERIADKKNQEEKRTEISYRLFIPVTGLEYDKVAISYRVSEKTEVLEIGVKGEADSNISLRKPTQEYAQFEINLNYSKEKAGYEVRYSSNGYQESLERARQDFTNRIDKVLEILPKSLMGGVLGFTYIGSGKMARRDDLTGDKALMVDVHEAIHTPDEYETRVLTDWMLKIEKPKYRM